MSVFSRILDFLGLYDGKEPVPDDRELDHVPGRRSNVVSLSQAKTSTRLVLKEPYSFEEAQQTADHLRNKRPVIMNLNQVDDDEARRIIDFLSGTVYALNGEIQKIGAHTFLLTPKM